MVRTETPVCDFNVPAIDFALPGGDGRTWSLADCAGEKGLLVMFICNHCPYVQSIRDLLQDADRDVRANTLHAIEIFEELGCTVEEVDVPWTEASARAA